jgi:hypothetical protein
VDTAGWIRPGQQARFDEAQGEVAQMTLMQGKRALNQVRAPRVGAEGAAVEGTAAC